MLAVIQILVQSWLWMLKCIAEYLKVDITGTRVCSGEVPVNKNDKASKSF